MTSPRNDSVALSQVLAAAPAGGRLPLSTALYACSELARLVATEHEMGRTVTGLDADHIRCTRSGGVVLSGARVHHPDVKADVQAVGAVLYQLLTGKAPSGRDLVAPSHFNPAVDTELDAVVVAALAREPAQRPASLRVVEKVLAAVFAELELNPTPDGLAELVGKARQVPAPVKAAAPVARPIIVKRAPPSSFYVDTVDEDEETESTLAQVPSWQTQERERKWMVGISAALVAVALLWALWPAPRSGRASLEDHSPVRVSSLRR